ncbi:hypothetical protein FKW77_007451 [Venturia effusa]|uniref:DNA repair and recombination protein RAD26 n=1 Tax=Venturia effusa TaxID=50376 RepID=A0A517LJ42_9PEZI|nr:hypothetical protein FKW77_007451 [Venturia effusa]
MDGTSAQDMVREEQGDLDVPALPTENTEGMDEEAVLNMFATAKDQDELERDIGRQADQLLNEQADEREKKRIDKTIASQDRIKGQLRKIDQRLAGPGGSATKLLLRDEKANLEAQLKSLDTDLEQIHARISQRQNAEDVPEEEALQGRNPNESRRDFLIRTGKITPFSRMPQTARQSSNLADVMLEAEESEDADAEEAEALAAGPQSHQVLRKPGFAEEEFDASSVAESRADDNASEIQSGRPVKRRKVSSRKEVRADSEEFEDSVTADSDASDAFVPNLTNRQLATLGESDDESADDRILAAATAPAPKPKRGAKSKPIKRKKTPREEEGGEDEEDLEGLDDGNEDLYQARFRTWCKKRSAARRKAQVRQQGNALIDVDEDEEECYKPHPTLADTDLGDGFRVPGDIFPSLYDYQKTGVRWLYELYSQQVGGIIGDEMGLGKTIQAIAFLAGLHYSKMITKPIIIVCPATLLKQWVNEFHRWWPPLRVSILHTSGSGMINLGREEALEDGLEEEEYYEHRKPRSKNHKAAKGIVDRVRRDGHVLVTTYSGLQSYADLLTDVPWEYAVLDEGHKIRNPNTSITMYCKELQTANRIILSGTPMQNNLTELWSLFDFVFPMRLGTLVSFRQQFEAPIKFGGYANASNLQVETANKCAETLKEAISPYLLQRWKADVAADLPKKTERVLFCKLTALQRKAYKDFLKSDDMSSILAGKRQALYGIDILRKICNHPDLVQHKRDSKNSGYGEDAKSGKMQVVKALLEMWKKAGHKTLLFAQHRIMLDILQKTIGSMEGFNVRRMDGNTSIKDRQNMVDEFNRDPSLHVFLLTTKVGGLGVNLTGANRVIIYDPDWNPSTDVQARERAWRLGQTREVEIYRLMTAGTIEEKIYHRQVFKQILTNKVLRDPKQRQTFQLKELHDLFTLGDEVTSTETGSLFKGTEIRFSDKGKAKTLEPSIPTPPTDNEQEQRTNLSTITGVSRDEHFEDGSGKPAGAQNGEGEDRVLSAIFSKSGVHSAHEHDAIVGSSIVKRKVTADPEMIQREARRVAALAARELQRSGEIARTITPGVPTWTGQFGSSGRPEERPIASIRGAARGGRGGSRGGISSSSVLSNLASRQAGPATPASRNLTPDHQPRGREWMAMIRDFIKAQGGSCVTQMLIDHFNRYCGTEQRTQEFRAMLKEIAMMEVLPESSGRGSGRGRRGGGGRARTGRAKWILKPEYRD